MTEESDGPGRSDHEHPDHHVEEVFEEVLEAVVETALEHADGGDGGTPAHARTGAARAITIVGLVLGGVAVGFVIRRLIADWPEVSDQIGSADARWLVLAGLCALAGMTSIAWGWRHVMAALGAHPPMGRTVAWYYVGELGKYLPGGVWPVLGRGELARRGGVARRTSYTSVALSLGMLYLAAMFVAAAFLPFALSSGSGFSPWMLTLLALPVGVVMLHHEVLEWLVGVASRAAKRDVSITVPRWHVSLGLVLRYVPTWLFIGTATYAVARSITTDLSYSRMMFATVLSWVVGFLAVPVPSGAGIREAVLFASSGLDKPVAITTAVGARIIFVLVDLVGAALAAPFVRHRQGTLLADPEASVDAEDGR